MLTCCCYSFKHSSSLKETSMNKYETLVTVLDQIRHEAPSSYKRYNPPEDKIEEINHARSRAFIHLFFKVKFGVIDFLEREEFITDDPQDGGIDGYYIDAENKKIYFIQSKFRTNEKNFNEREILLSELLQMDVDRVAGGHEVDANDVPYNSKIKKAVQAIQKILDIGRWKYEVVIIANISSKIDQPKLKRIFGGFETSIYSNTRVYKDLLFPVVQGTFYNPNELTLSINLSNTGSQNSEVTYKVKTAKKECDITLIFVPTIEIAKAMYKYRNSILKFNPRSYLELSHNEVNKEIAKSITELSTNEFSLFNNGITVLSYGTDFNKQIGQMNKGQLIIKQPQFINGGQTAFTLSRIYEEYVIDKKNPSVFDNKEVLIKVLTFHPDELASQNTYLDLIESISKATNQQSQVIEADRRSNDQIQIQLQEFLFEKYGCFYERKRGEYADGIKAGYLHRSQVIDRDIFLRICKCCDQEPSSARRMGSQQIFERQHFENTLRDPNRFEEFFLAYQCFQVVQDVKKKFSKDKNNKFGFLNYGSGLQFGMYAIVSACMLNSNGEGVASNAEGMVQTALSKWVKFEEYAISLSDNSDYFRQYTDPDSGTKKQDLNFNNYYKGRTLMRDILDFFQLGNS